MIKVEYPVADFQIKKNGNSDFIYDSIRKKWLLLTEEEWVRQNILAYIIKSLKYPATLIAVEKEIILNSLKKRFDILIYNKQHKPWMMVECKAPEIKLNEEVLQQILRYNMSVPVNYIIITNGKGTIGWEKINSSLKNLDQFPEWQN